MTTRRTKLVLAFIAVAGMLLAPFATHQPARADDAGPVAVVGNFASVNAAVSPEIFPQPVPVLVDATRFLVPDQSMSWATESGQIVGSLTTPMFPGPGEYRIDLPIEPGARPIDLDQDGAQDPGVQVFYFILASNVVGNSFLQQLEQIGGLLSIGPTGDGSAIGDSSLLVWSPDGEQGFPEAAGADGTWFTADDTIRTLEPGYTVVNLRVGTATFDRSREARLDIPPIESEAPPDFSDQSILDSFNSLIDTLNVRYAYTELRGVDWEAVRAQYLPDVQAADAAGDMGAYLAVLQAMAASLLDAHVEATSLDTMVRIGALTIRYANLQGGLGVNVFAPSDPANPNGPGDRVLISSITSTSPGQAFGWVPGTEIISVNGQTPAERLAQVPLVQSVGTEEAAKLQRLVNFFGFPIGTEVTVEFRNPGESEVKSATMVADSYGDEAPAADAATPVAGDTPLTVEPSTNLPLQYAQFDGFSVVRFKGFSQNVLPTIALLEYAIKNQTNEEGTGGIVLDLRGNTGGWIELQQILASYFFTADQPGPQTAVEPYVFDPATQQFVSGGVNQQMLSAPVPDRAFTGHLVILVDQYCASSCEFMSYQLQSLGRATIIGQYGTVGAGGILGHVRLPGQIIFNYTAGRAMKPGTNEPAFEGKGVQPDIRVPVTLETEQAMQAGGDPVMAVAIAYLGQQRDETLAALEAAYEAQLQATPEASPQP